jgi:hypothetical protein
MTIKRQYTLPNCNLILEGMSGEDINNLAAPMTILLNAECQFPGIPTPLVGGRDFLEGLIQAVNPYSQSLLSGVSATQSTAAVHGVSLSPEDKAHYHRLTLAATDKADGNAPVEIKLTNVQLFDLMEAVDQLLADAQTLPDLTLALSPLARRDIQSQTPLAQQAAPIALGTSGLAAAATLLFFLPVPNLEPIRIEEERPTQTEASTPTSSTAETGASAAPPGSPTGDDSADPEVTNFEISDEALAASRILARLSAAPAIADGNTLTQLQDDLTGTLEADWVAPDSLETPLTYRVAVSETGDLLGYRHEDAISGANVEETPLPELVYTLIDIEDAVEEPVAQFEVTLDPDGTVTVEPAEADN